ncbi:hypothetical protein Ahy_A04g019597 [Arachis hypogaea]|uniref:Uncharacterized protein n=1 Tax=Arachis hypogaea TaxID=3818 RepID=A0A445DGB5_ARAHY|nr:hypothetical protein Ahy_A04g019597 [Arachis hypogaea]
MEGTEEVSSNFQENVTPRVEEDPIENETFVAETESVPIGASQSDDQRDVIFLDGIGSFGAIDFDALRAEEIMMIEFVDLKTAYDFYNENDRKMDPRPVTRCGCNARIKVHVDSRNRRWYVDFFSDEHNYDMLEARFRGMIWSYRAIKTRHLHQINTMRSSGLRVPTIFRAFANQSGGFEMVGFQVKDIYNAIEKQRRAGASDTDNALKRVVVADYKFAYGEPVVKTRLEELERFAAAVYTREGEIDDEFRCSCLRMESFGIPCVHIVGVLVRLNMVVIPGSLILGRWTKKAKQPPINNHVFSGEIPDAAYMSMHAAMLDDCRELVKLSCSNFEDYFEVKTKIANERDALREKIRKRLVTTAEGEGDDASIHDPPRARHKGCGRHVVTTRGRYWRVQRCRKCGKAGHNTRRCATGNGEDTTHELDAFGSSHNMDESQEAEASQQMEYDDLSF